MRNALAQANRVSVDGCEIHAIDNASAMIEASRSIISLDEESITTERCVPIHLHEADLEAHPLDNASVVAMNFTLQFVNPAARAELMQKIANALQPGGVLILSEKVRFADSFVNDMHIDMYHSFKSQNGYSDLEISQKRTALENVLVPDTLEEHRDRLMDAGFSHCTVWFQCFNFASLIAIK
jgi:tRNA (cmo5U34)-methyltransferase